MTFSDKCFICAKAKRQQQYFICAKAKRQQQCFICAKAKRQQQSAQPERKSTPRYEPNIILITVIAVSKSTFCSNSSCVDSVPPKD